MPIIYFDKDKADNLLIPSLENELQKLSNTIEKANHIQFPKGEFNFPSVVGDLNDCKRTVQRYKSWINTTKNEINTLENNLEEEIGKLEIAEIPLNESIVN